MRLTFLILILFISSAVFAQSRKSILYEINAYKKQAINETSFYVTKDSLNIVLLQYITQQKYALDTITKNGLIYSLQPSFYVEITYTTTPDNSLQLDFTTYFPEDYTSWSSCKQTKPAGGKKYIRRSDNPLQPGFTRNFPDRNASNYNQVVLSDGIYYFPREPTSPFCNYYRNSFNFKIIDVMRFLYVHFYGQYIAFPRELSDKIEAYNLAQKKEKKKLKKGRDY